MPVTSLEPELKVLPPDWPGSDHEGGRPGDLSLFVPQGLGLAPPMIVLPYGGMASPSHYGAQGPIVHPIRSAPTNDDAGGVIYFADRTPHEDLLVALRLMGLRELATDYAVFTWSSENPGEDLYLDQMRIVGKSALAHFFRAPASQIPEQSLDVAKAIERFIAWQRWKWHDGPESGALRGCLGGDGDWAKERLAFGALIENAYWSVYRVWSRPWLITK